MDYRWVADKLPTPNKEMIFESLIESKKDTMPHSEFYYPNTNDQQTTIDAIAVGLDVKCGYEVKKIAKSNTGWLINDEFSADILISTIPLKELPKLIAHVPYDILNSAEDLKYNKISNVLWRSKPTTKTWTYYPLQSSIFHRYIHIGSFHSPVTSYTITETMGERSFETMVEKGRKDPFLIEPLDYNISDYAYVVFDDKREAAVERINNYMNQISLYNVGRFAQWEYFNMDVCMKECFLLFDKLIKKYRL
jgi:protoporphyrinogen oxidase